MEKQVDQLVVSNRLLIGLGDVATQFLLEGETENHLQVLLGELDLVLNALYLKEHEELS